MSHTERERYQFVVKQTASGKPWIDLQPVHGNLSILESPQRLTNVADYGFLGFDLPDDMTFDEAEKLADLLDEKIVMVSFTRLLDPGP